MSFAILSTRVDRRRPNGHHYRQTDRLLKIIITELQQTGQTIENHIYGVIDKWIDSLLYIFEIFNTKCAPSLTTLQGLRQHGFDGFGQTHQF